jgi:hypothetical protein
MCVVVDAQTTNAMFNSKNFIVEDHLIKTGHFTDGETELQDEK